VQLLPAGNFAGYKEIHMTRCSLSKKLTVRSDRGYVVAPPETFSTGFFEQTQTGMAPVADSAVIEASLAILAKRVARGSVLSSPSAVKNFLVTRLVDLEYEIFGVVLLTTRHHLIDFVELFRGTLDGASVAPREVLKLVLGDGLTVHSLQKVLLIVQCGREIRLNGGITVVPRIGAPTGAANPWSAMGIEDVRGERFFTLSCGNIASH
jgi:hypothetical protein